MREKKTIANSVENYVPILVVFNKTMKKQGKLMIYFSRSGAIYLKNPFKCAFKDAIVERTWPYVYIYICIAEWPHIFLRNWTLRLPLLRGHPTARQPEQYPKGNPSCRTT